MKVECDEGIHGGPYCAHMVVEYSPTLHYSPTLCPGCVTQSKSDRWVCRSCGAEFVPRSRLDALHDGTMQMIRENRLKLAKWIGRWLDDNFAELETILDTDSQLRARLMRALEHHEEP